MRFRFVAAERAQHTVSRLCSVLGVTRQGFYAWRHRELSARRVWDQQIKELILAAYERSWRTYGVPRMHAELSDHGIRISRKRVARLMRELGIEGVSRRRGRKRTTIQAEAARSAPDLLERRFHAERPDQMWVADITYIPTHEGWLFLAAVVDLCSRRVVGWSMRADLEADLVVDAVSMAIARRSPQPASCTTRIAAANTPRSRSVRRFATRAWSRAWAAAATPTTTRWPRAS